MASGRKCEEQFGRRGMSWGWKFCLYSVSNKELLEASLEACENKFVFWGAPSALTLHEQSSGPSEEALAAGSEEGEHQ